MNSVMEYGKKNSIPSIKQIKEKERFAKTILNLVEKTTKEFPQITKVEFGGSYAKGTWLPENADIDIFIKIKKNVSKNEFEVIGKKVGTVALKKFKPYFRYAEHPFVEANVEGKIVNVVPCYDVKKGDWKSSADRSVYHTEFMLRELSGKMKNQVRILKKFLKANEIYGAEISKQGFSGYVCEVLIYEFGSFQKVLKNISNLKPDQIIGKTKRKFESAITIIDPIDENRNLGAAISNQNVSKFVLLSREFIRNPSKRIFQEKKIKQLSGKLQNAIVLEFNFKERSKDIIWGQLKRASNSLTTQLQIQGFTVIRNSASIDKTKNHAALIFCLLSNKINDELIRKGPDVFNQKNCQEFISKNMKKSKIMWVNVEGKICCLQKRKNSNANEFLKNLISNNTKNSGIPNGLTNDLKKFKISFADQVSSEAIKEDVSRLILTDDRIFHFNKKNI